MGLKTQDLRTYRAHRICLIKPSALGDIVQTLPLLPVLRERFPAARISWVVGSQFANLLEGHPDLDELLIFHRRGGSAAFLQLLTDLKKRRFDLVFDLQGLMRTGLMTFATRAPLRIGLETAREGAHWACHLTLPGTSKHVPAHSRNWQVAEAFGMGSRRRETTIPLTGADRIWARNQLAPLSSRILVIHAGAQWETKRWPPEHFVFVASKAARRLGMSPVLVGSPGERNITTDIERQIRRFVPSARIANLAGETSLKQLAAVLERAEVVLSNDSGPMHMAAGLGVPVVGVRDCLGEIFPIERFRDPETGVERALELAGERRRKT